MLKKVLIRTGAVLAILILLVIGFIIKAYYSTEKRINTVYKVEPQPLSIPSDSSALAHGNRLLSAKGCRDCHGDDLGGKVFIDDKPLGFLVARNLTKGKGGLPEDHNTSDWVLALKHGIRKDGKPLWVMPSHEYTLLSEKDLSAIIAYTMSLPRVDREFPEQTLGVVGTVLTNLGKLDLLPAEMIDHNRQLVKEVQAEVTVDFGKYLSAGCQGCHRTNMKGGDPIAPGFPMVADISPTGNVAHWTEAQFINTLRTGNTPEGKVLNPAEMPWKMTAAYTDTELKALFLYLNSL
jgi:mono/diheme cytochrome c family protein